MAIWETAEQSAAYISGKRSSTNVSVTKVTDNKNDENTLEVDEQVTITFGNGRVFRNYFYRGTITHEGEEYPVIQSSLGTYVVLGTTSSSLPQEISLSDLNSNSFTVCFFPGTLIATPFGERKVEELVSGDPVLIGDSGAIPATWIVRKFARAVSVKWVGRQTVSTLFGPAERLMPVRFAAGSLGGGGAFPSAA